MKEMIVKSGYRKITLALLVLCLFVGGCRQEESKNYIISHYFGSDEDVEKYVKTLNEEQVFNKVFVNDTPRIEIIATEKQADNWVAKKKEDITNCIEDINPDDEYNISFNEDYSVMTISATANRNMQALSFDFFKLLYDAEMIQLFTGHPEWAVEIVIINTDTGHTIYDIVYPEEDIDIADTLWDE